MIFVITKNVVYQKTWYDSIKFGVVITDYSKIHYIIIVENLLKIIRQYGKIWVTKYYDAFI